MKQPPDPKGPADPVPDPQGEISDLADLKAIAESMRVGAGPRASVTASELSGVVARHDSVVGARVGQRHPLAGVPPWFWGVVGCLSVMAVGLGVFWYLTVPLGVATASQQVGKASPPASTAAQGPQIVPMKAPPHPERAAEPAHPEKAPARRAAGSNRGARDEAVAAAVEAPEPEAALAKPIRKSELDTVLAAALDSEPGDGTRKTTAARARSDSSDKQPDRARQDVDAALEDLQPRVQQCFHRFQIRGIAQVNLTVTSAGSVQSPALTGDFEGTPTGDCVIKELASAALPPFKGGPVRISHQYVFR